MSRPEGAATRIVEWDDDNPETLFAELALGCAQHVGLVLAIGCDRGLSLELAELAEEVADLDPADARALPFADGALDLVCSRRGAGEETVEALADVGRVLKPGGMLVALALGESHRIETQEIFGRGQHWPPVRPLRFSIPERLRQAGLETASFSEYYGVGYSPDIDSFAIHLAASRIIPGFDRDRDAALLREVERKLRTPRGLRDTEHVAVFVAQKGVWMR